MPTLFMLQGLPASGKTFWAKQKMTQEPNRFKRVNKDDMRAMIDNGVWSKANEAIILHFRDHMIEEFLKQQKDVIVDDTNLHPKHERRFIEIAEANNAHFQPITFFEVPLEKCIERDRSRHKCVGEKVIRDMYERFSDKFIVTPKPNLPKTILCDLDGTLAHMHDRGPFDWKQVGNDTVDPIVLEMVRLYRDKGYTILFISGRDASCFSETDKWLTEYGFAGCRIMMRGIGDNRKDSIVKEELYRNHIKENFDIHFVLDDRQQVVDMWRNLGLKCLQVAPGNF